MQRGQPFTFALTKKNFGQKSSLSTGGAVAPRVRRDRMLTGLVVEELRLPLSRVPLDATPC